MLKHCNANHADHFVESLSANSRNSLRVILESERALKQLRHALGMPVSATTTAVSERDYRLGLAKTGRTIELFTGVRLLSPADLRERR